MHNNKGHLSAETLLGELVTKGFIISAPIDVDKIASMLNLRVIHDPSLESRDIIGEILFDNKSPIIKINPFQNSYLPRMRFTLAHEIGHFYLHSSDSKEGFSDSRKTMSRSDSYWDKYESEANNFAAQLLMPKSLVISEGSKIITRYKEVNNVGGMPVEDFIEKISRSLQVSTKAMEYRLKNLNVI